MDVRAGRAPVLPVAIRQLDRFNRRHPWSHNDHFHGWILRRLPDRRGRALDVGCGRGGLVAALADHFGHVDGIDADAPMAHIARQRCAEQVRVRHLRFDEVTGSYDLITMVAVLHHLELERALRHARDLLTGGGRLLLVGLALPSTAVDLGFDIASAVLNPLVGFVKHPRVARPDASTPRPPVADPTLTFDEIRARATALLPGARMRHRLFFRYTLEWTKPACVDAVGTSRGTSRGANRHGLGGRTWRSFGTERRPPVV